MNEREIGRIKKKFILVSTLAFFGVMLMMGGFIYLFSNLTQRNEVRRIMEFITDNDGELPDIRKLSEQTGQEYTDIYDMDNKHTEDVPDGGQDQHDGSGDSDESMAWKLQNLFGVGDLFGNSPDYLYTTRFFSVLFNKEGELEEVKLTHIAMLNEETAVRYAKVALHKFFKFGNFGRYYYYVADRPDDAGTIVIYLDRSTQIATIDRVVFASLSLMGIGTILAFCIMRVLSQGVVRSEVKNAERQKQFITNASHELKTPLAVIRANTEMQEMVGGATEWTESTLKQVDRLNGLIANLVMISRAQENDTGEIKDMDIAAIVRETAQTFTVVAESDNKHFHTEIPDTLMHRCNEGGLRQLLSLLIDNAVKYCDEGGQIGVSLTTAGRGGRWALLQISNDYKDGENTDYNRFFERFYRSDESHNSKGGYGIGLSVVAELVKNMRGTIDAGWKDGRIIFTVKL